MSVAVLGLGLIGSAWSTNLRADGLDVRVWNRTPRNVPGCRATAREAATGADVIIVVVADPPAVRAVLDDVVPALTPEQVVVQSSTVSPADTLSYAAQVTATGAAFLEAPFTGSKPAAEARQTVFYAGGDADVIARAGPVLRRLSKAILHIGPTGSASALKLALNMNIAGAAAALSESLAFARAAGLSDDTFFSALGLNVARSGLSDLKEPKLKANDFSPQFSVKHMAKDLRLALGARPELNLPTTAAVRAVYEQGLANGMGDDDFIGLIRLIKPKG